jgi:hypothetical protein
MQFGKIVGLTALGLIVATQVHARPELPNCPGLDTNGHRLPLAPAAVSQATSSNEDIQPVPEDVAKAARRAIGHFESGGGDAYANVSSLDTISIGYLQWNWGTGSLVDKFVATLNDSDIALAAEPLRDDLAVLKRSSRRAGDRSAAEAVIRRWTSAGTGHPLVRGVRKSVREQLSTWLALPAIEAVQDKLIDPKLRLAHSYARQWLEDSADIRGDSGNLKETTTSFFDLLTYNDGRQGLWVPHVREFRTGFASNREIIDFIADWTISCDSVEKSGSRDKKLYNAGEASSNARKWKERVASNPSAFTDNQTNLLIFGYLRALRSVGANPPRGFPGIFQADVMLRRGAVALGVGEIRGVAVGTVLE